MFSLIENLRKLEENITQKPNPAGSSTATFNSKAPRKLPLKLMHYFIKKQIR